MQWLGIDVAGYATEAALEPHYNPTVALGGDRWRHASPAGRSVHLRANGTSLPHIRMRYRIAADGPWSSYSENRRTLDASLLPAEPAVAEWRDMPFRTDAEAAAGLRGGDQGQMWHGMNRSASVPSLIIAGQDTGGFWWSDDDGLTWSKAPDEGLRGFGMQGVLVDPEDPSRWYGVGEALFQTDANDASPYGGIYLSTDKGEHWVQVYSEPLAHHQRAPAEIACDPGTRGAWPHSLRDDHPLGRQRAGPAVDRPRRELGRALDHPGHGIGRQRQGAGQLALAPPEPVRGAVPLHPGRPLQVDGRRRRPGPA